MSEVTVSEGKLRFKRLMKTCEIPLEDLVWAYLQKEECGAILCCGRVNMEITRVIVQDRSGRQERFQYEDSAKAKALLEQIARECPSAAIGYTPENRKRFGAT